MNVELCIAITVTLQIIFIGIIKAMKIAEEICEYALQSAYNILKSRHEIHI